MASGLRRGWFEKNELGLAGGGMEFIIEVKLLLHMHTLCGVLISHSLIKIILYSPQSS